MRFAKRLLALGVLALTLAALAIYFYPLEAAKIMPFLPNIETFPLSTESPKTVEKGTTTLLRSSSRDYVPLEKIPVYLQNAVVSIEDQRFYEHRGVDLLGIARAIYNNITRHEFVEGGSTITQQLVRNLYLSQAQTINRKLTEAMLSLQLEEYYKDKDKILELYLNNIYFGRNAWGINRAAYAYFNKRDLASLTISESAYLAGLPQSPSYYGVNEDAALSRQKMVIQKMKELGYLRNDYKNNPPTVRVWNNKVTLRE